MKRLSLCLLLMLSTAFLTADQQSELESLREQAASEIASDLHYPGSAVLAFVDEILEAAIQEIEATALEAAKAVRVELEPEIAGLAEERDRWRRLARWRLTGMIVASIVALIGVLALG